MALRDIAVIGIDCAAQAKNTGIAFGVLDTDGLTIEEARAGESVDDLVATVTRWIKLRPVVLLALDAPLGWPRALGAGLVGHAAGEFLSGAPNELFRRQTDVEIRRRFGKVPLEVGADRIARAARAALELLHRLRERAGLELPLLWDHRELGHGGVIEVYPAATLLAAGLSTKTAAEGRDFVEETKRQWLLKACKVPQDAFDAARDPNVRDAIICGIAGARFLAGQTAPPDNLDLATKEGWIWV